MECRIKSCALSFLIVLFPNFISYQKKFLHSKFIYISEQNPLILTPNDNDSGHPTATHKMKRKTLIRQSMSNKSLPIYFRSQQQSARNRNISCFCRRRLRVKRSRMRRRRKVNNQYRHHHHHNSYFPRLKRHQKVLAVSQKFTTFLTFVSATTTTQKRGRVIVTYFRVRESGAYHRR